ncbi:MAG: phosphate propanoyltransferase [Elusimicrobia bacterium]|nr:phosphate propanoyltransferase [Elusimicrobiota bacterium]
MAADRDLAVSIADEIARRLSRSELRIPVGVSNRHAHLTRPDFEALFGAGAGMTELRPLGQPGQFACRETVEVEGPKGRIRNVRILGPARPASQVEVSRTDAFALGISPPVRQSGNLEGASPVRLHGPRGTVDLEGAAIVAQRHLHVHPSDGRRLGLADGEVVRVRAGGPDLRAVVFENVVARVSDKFALEFHVDTDEGNAAWLKTGDAVTIV